METIVLVLEDYKKTGVISEADLEKIREAAEILKEGGLVAFPTETVYGLGGDARRADVSARIYAAKGRPSDNPLIVHISCMGELAPLVQEIPENCRKLAAAYWPGPMTLVMGKSDLISKETTGGLDTVAVRMPVHPVAAKLIELSGVPVAAPSANRSGRPSTTTAEHCVEDLFGRIDLILDGGPCDIGVESTIVDLTGAEPVLLRPGAVTMEMLSNTLGREPAKDKAVLRALEEGEKPKAPGMKYRHYAPQAPLIVVRAAENAREGRSQLTENRQEGRSQLTVNRQEGRSQLTVNRQEGRSQLTVKEESFSHRGLLSEADLSAERDCPPWLKQNSREGTSPSTEKVYRRIAELAEEYLAQGLRTEVICTEECAEWLRENRPEQAEIPLRVLGKQDDSLKISQNLFAVLRDTDEDKVDRLIAEGFGENDLFLAIMNRLKKAAGWQIVEV